LGPKEAPVNRPLRIAMEVPKILGGDVNNWTIIWVFSFSRAERWKLLLQRDQRRRYRIVCDRRRKRVPHMDGFALQEYGTIS